VSVPAIPGELFPNPITGEVVDLTKPDEVAGALRDLRGFRAEQLASAIRYLEGILLEEMERQGTKTLRYGGVEAKASTKNETIYDVEALRASLGRAGCPEERINDLITEEVTYKVNGSVARELSGANPKYARAIKRAKTVVPGPTYVSVK